MTLGDRLARGGRRKDQWGIEQTLSDWLSVSGALVAVLPPPSGGTGTATDWIGRIDALVIQGGSDLHAPLSTSTDRRDVFELELLGAALDAGVPVLGICRGMQLINMAFGGSLRMLDSEDASVGTHSDPERYDAHSHPVRVSTGLHRNRVYGGSTGQTSSMHRHGIDRLGSGLAVEAWCAVDNTIEAVRASAYPWVRGVQWHPEFHQPGMMPTAPMLQNFLDATRNA